MKMGAIRKPRLRMSDVEKAMDGFFNRLLAYFGHYCITTGNNTTMTTDATNFQPNVIELKLERVLVVIGPDLVKPNAPRESTLLMRAVALATATCCELELFHVCDDPSLRMPFFPQKA